MIHLILLILAGVCFGLAFLGVSIQNAADGTPRYNMGWLGFALLVLDWLLTAGAAGPVIHLALLILAGVLFLLAFWNVSLRGYSPGWLGWLLIVVDWLLATS